jgi:hypothetical protein
MYVLVSCPISPVPVPVPVPVLASRARSEGHGGLIWSYNVTFSLHLWKSYGTMTTTAFITVVDSLNHLVSCVVCAIIGLAGQSALLQLIFIRLCSIASHGSLFLMLIPASLTWYSKFNAHGMILIAAEFCFFKIFVLNSDRIFYNTKEDFCRSYQANTVSSWCSNNSLNLSSVATHLKSWPCYWLTASKFSSVSPGGCRRSPSD